MSSKKQSCASPGLPQSTYGDSPASEPPLEEYNTSFKEECERALAVFREGSPGKALGIIRGVISRQGERKDSVVANAILHRLQGMFYSCLVSRARDSEERLKYLESTVESASRAAELVPNSLEFANFLSLSLFELARNRDPKEYGKVIEECKRGLSLQNPTDPLEDNLFLDLRDWGNLSTPESRIQSMNEQINLLLEQCVILTDLEHKGFRVKLPSLNLTIDDNFRAPEKKVVAQTQEKENKMKDRLSKKHQRKAETREKEPDIISVKGKEEKMETMRSLWASMSTEKKRALMRVKIEDLKPYIKSVKGKEVFEEAIHFATKKNRWKFWECGACGESFLACESYKQHFTKEHVKDLEQSLKIVLPDEVDRKYADMIMNFDWKPVDRVAALKMIENEPRSESFDVDQASNESKEASSQEDSVSELGGNWQSKEWPIINDGARESYLRTLQGLFQLLLKLRCLSSTLVNHTTNFSFEQLESLIPESFLAGYGLRGWSPQCFCFLEVDSLERLLVFMQNMISESGVYKDAEEARDDDVGIAERIYFNSDLSVLILDERLLKGELNICVCDDDDESSAVSIAPDKLSEDLPHNDAFILWLFGGPMMGEESVLQKLLQENKKGLQNSAIRSLEIEWGHLETTCKKKRELWEYEAALSRIQKAFRKQDPNAEPRTYVSLIKQRHEQLLEMNSQTMSGRNKAMLKAMQNILEHEKDGKQSQGDEWAEDRVKWLLKNCSIDVAKTDTAILLSHGTIDRLQLELTRLSAYDYRSFALLLMKLNIREKLQDLVDEDAKKKADAASEALLAELEDEAAKNINKQGDGKRQTQGKSKDRKAKTKKDSRKNKATNTSKTLPLDQDSAGGENEGIVPEEENKGTEAKRSYASLVRDWVKKDVP